MTVELEGIKFNYEDDLTKTGTFNIRRNETTPVSIPEWPPQQGSDFKSSPAAYAIAGLPEVLTIQASFNAGGLQGPVTVKAVATSSDKILGDVEMVEIPASGSSGFIPLKLPNALVNSAGVGIHDITWSWQFSTPSIHWTEFQQTNHRIYTVLARPSEPWEAKSREASNIHQPWTAVLDLACQWAAGVSGDPDPAATRVAREFFKEVSKVATYKKAGSYAFSKFKLTKFLRLLADDNGVSHTVNCDDCATVVSTFANILGCELFQSGLGPSFNTHEVLTVGAEKSKARGFRYHAVAWKGACEANDDVFDGCLQIDEDHTPPFTGVQPTDIPFGDDKKGYKFFLVNGFPNCRPLPDHKDYGSRRRKFGQTTYLGDAAITEADLISELKRDFDFDSWPAVGENGIDGTGVDFAERLKGSVSSDWSFRSGDRFTDDRFPEVFDALFTRSDLVPAGLLATTVYRTKTNSDPNLNLLEILGRFEELDFKRLNRPTVGDVAFVDSDSSTVVFRRGRLLAVVRSASKRQLSVVRDAQELDHLLVEMSGSSKEVSEESILIARRSSMAHKFKELRSVWTYAFTEDDKLTLVPAGNLFIDKIKDDGEIPEGYFIDETKTAHPIKGRAYKHTDDTYLTFSYVDGPDTYLGRLATNPEDDDKIVVIGSIYSDDPEVLRKRKEAGGLFDQEELPIVITKP